MGLPTDCVSSKALVDTEEGGKAKEEGGAWEREKQPVVKSITRDTAQ